MKTALGQVIVRSGLQAAQPVLLLVFVGDDHDRQRLEARIVLYQGGQFDAVHAGHIHYDLVVTDVDMPRMDGIELTTLIKNDARLKSLPVMIVSYKDQEQDRLRGLEAGADYYLPKGSFHDETLLQAVVDLIGEPEA